MLCQSVLGTSNSRSRLAFKKKKKSPAGILFLKSSGHMPYTLAKKHKNIHWLLWEKMDSLHKVLEIVQLTLSSHRMLGVLKSLCSHSRRLFNFTGEINSFSRKSKKHFNAHSILDKLIDRYNISTYIYYRFLFLPKFWYLELGAYDFAESLLLSPCCLFSNLKTCTYFSWPLHKDYIKGSYLFPSLYLKNQHIWAHPVDHQDHHLH